MLLFVIILFFFIHPVYFYVCMYLVLYLELVRKFPEFLVLFSLVIINPGIYIYTVCDYSNFIMMSF